MITWVIGNGPSNRRWHGVKMHPSIGCNYGIKDFDLDHLVCVDRMAVHAVSKLPKKPNTTYWCKQSPLETPKGWQECEPVGMDSGSTAIKLAHTLYPQNQIIAIGFDGVLNQSNENAYTYHFRNNPTTTEKTRLKHRGAILELIKTLPNTRFVGNQPDPELEVITYDQAFKIAIT